MFYLTATQVLYKQNGLEALNKVIFCRMVR